jgi:hypothetical protein
VVSHEEILDGTQAADHRRAPLTRGLP